VIPSRAPSGRTLHRPQPARLRGDGAFTLIELLLVVVIISVLACSLAAALQGRKDAQALRVGTEDLAAAMRFAWSQAASRGRPFRIALLKDGRAFQVQTLDEQGAPQPLPGLTGNQRSFAREVHVRQVGAGSGAGGGEKLPEAIQFCAGAGFSGWVELSDGAGQSRRIEVADATGQVRIIE